MNGLNLDAFNSDVKNWGRDTLALQRAAVAIASGSLQRNLRVKYPKRFGAISAISFQFPRHGIYVEKGAGKGYAGKKGSRWTGATGPRRTNPKSLGKAGTGNRPAKPWYNPAVDRKIDSLATTVAEHFADAAINVIRIK